MNEALVVLTDYDWYSLLVQKNITKQANFWTPTPWGIKNLAEGGLVYFLLKKDYGRRICGYGTFIKYEESTIQEAWESFGVTNGVSNYTIMKTKVKLYAERNSKQTFDCDKHKIGNIVLKDLVLFDAESQFSVEEYGWSVPYQVVKSKYVVKSKHEFNTKVENESFTLIDINEKSIVDESRKQRRGCSQFRNSTMKNYNYKCCITGETEVSILEAAHIQEYLSEKSNHPQNALLLRVDIHRLFDQGLITIDDNYKVCVSSKLDSENYKKLQGKVINLPSKNYIPSKDAINWHYINVFRK